MRSAGFSKALFGLLGFVILLWSLYLTQLHRLLPRDAGIGWWAAASHCLLVAGGLALALGLLTAPLSLSARPWVGRLGRLLASLVAAILVAAGYVDARMVEVMGVHLYDPVVLALLGRGSVNETLHITLREILFACAGIAAVAAVLIGVGWAGVRVSRRGAERGWLSWVQLGVLCCLPLGGWLGSWQVRAATAPAATRALPLSQLLFASSTAGRSDAYTLHYPKIEGPLPGLQRKPSFLLILVETLRGDMLTAEHMPETWALQARPHCARSQNHQASSHSTDHCLFSLMYGLHSYHYQVLGKRNVPSYPLRVLKQNGYRLVGGSSAPLVEWGELSYVTEQLHEFYEAKGSGPAERDLDLLAWATRFLSKHGQEEPYFLVVFLDASHHKYYYPPAFEHYTPTLPESHSLITGNEQDPGVRARFVNRYKNSVRFVDSSVATLLRRFEEREKGNDWIAVVTGDHGEEFWDHGLLGHASVSFVNARVRVPLVACTSDGSPLSIPLSSHVDIMPTFLDYAALEPPVSSSDYSNGVSLLRPPDPARWVLVSSIEFPEKNRELALVSQTTKFLVSKQRWGNKDFQVVAGLDAEDLPVQSSTEEAARALAWLRGTYRGFFLPGR